MPDDRPTSTPPEVKKTKTLAKAAIDIMGLLVIAALTYLMSWPWQVSLPAIFTVLGLMRFMPIAEKGGPLAFALAAVTAMRSAA